MLTYNEITKNGRLGNQLFQYATLRAVGIKTKNTIGFSNLPKKSFDGSDTIFNFNIIKNKNYVSPKKQYREKYFYFDESIFTIDDDTDIFGYFQSWKYFDNIREILKREIIPTDTSKIQSINNFLYDFNPKNEKVCAIHVRRGDYLKKEEYHPVCNKTYYENSLNIESIKYMKKIIVTDDKEWCEQNFTNIPISPFINNIEDLWLMKNCDAVIMANSSFSWWGAYLGKNEIVIAPKNWFGSAANINASDLYMNHWILL
jgi:hypothetical protein